jgi:lipopolysaccharide transport system ATP-binding protein
MGRISIDGVGKAYKRYSGKWARLQEWITGHPRHEKTWVLRDVSFRVEPGEAVGIVGMNGAGKSTLLKIITGTTEPTAGRVTVEGRVAALLELGMGFHPDFTGRQNALIAGQLLGYREAEVAAVMNQIEQFAEIGEYFDRPVRIYSSGMQVRLAFSAATAVRPDVLIVDEALAVGDVFFQQKCFERIRGFRDQGTTLLFVSHSMGSVYALCDRAVLLDHGRLLLAGQPKEVIDLYNAQLATSHSSGAPRVREVAEATAAPAAAASAPETVLAAAPNGSVGSYYSDGVEIESVRLLGADGRDVSAVVADSKLTVRVRVRFRGTYADPHVGFQLRNSRGEALFMTTTHGRAPPISAVEDGTVVEVEFTFCAAVAEGEYTVTAGVADGALPDGPFRTALARVQDAAALTVVRNIAAPRWSGAFNLAPECNVLRPAASEGSGQSMKVLATTSRSFLLVDVVTGKAEVVHRGAGLYYGIAARDNQVFVAARRRMVSSADPAESEAGAILVFDRALRHVRTIEPPIALRDLHGIAFDDDGVLWATCSFDDMVARWDGRDWTTWHPLGEPVGEPRDVHHFNSLLFEGDLVWVLAHNFGPSELLGFDRHSLVLRHRVGLGVQAHDIWREGGRLHTCSSAEGRILGEGGFELPTGQFPRGYLNASGLRLVGLSELAERNERDFTAGAIRRYDQQWTMQGEIRLEGEGLLLALASLPA